MMSIKVSIDENGRYYIDDRKIAMRHRLQMGTITGTNITVNEAAHEKTHKDTDNFLSRS
jgi:hypothetical protein